MLYGKVNGRVPSCQFKDTVKATVLHTVESFEVNKAYYTKLFKRNKMKYQVVEKR
jgi:hypothetical protein